MKVEKMATRSNTAPVDGIAKVTDAPLTDEEIDDLLTKLTSEEIEKLLEETDPDDEHVPPSARCTYHCEKAPTGPLNRKSLLNYIYEQAKKTPDRADYVPHVPGTVRGTRWIDPRKVEEKDDSFELDIDLGDEIEMALNEADTQDMIDLAGIMGLHSMINQEQYHAAVSNKSDGNVDKEIGWDGITKATPLKYFPPESPNLTDPEEVLQNILDQDEKQEEVNLNNVPVSEKMFLDIFNALKENKVLTSLSLANTCLTDWAAANFSHTIECNSTIEKINLESNNITPGTLSKLFEALNIQESVKELKASNQAAQCLGNRVEMAITKSIENNKTLLKVGLQFEFNECRNRVAVHLQKNLDRVRLKRIAEKLTSRGNVTAGYFAPPPGSLNVWTKATTPESEYEYYYSDEED